MNDRQGIYSLAKEKLKDEQQRQMQKKHDELVETKRKLEQTTKQLQQLKELQTSMPVKLGDFSLIDSSFTTSLLATMKGMVEGYTDTLSRTQAKIDELDKRNTQTVSAMQKALDDNTVMFEKIMATLEELVYVLKRNSDLEKTVLERINIELNH